MIGLLLNDNIAATIIGVSFTATIGLMAWIVKTLAELDVRVEDHDKRLDRLERLR